MRLIIAVRAFFSALFTPGASDCIADALRLNKFAKQKGEQATSAPVKKSPLSIAPREGSLGTTIVDYSKVATSRSDALTLLAVMQKESRILDLIFDDLDGYSDEQIGGASRQVLRDLRDCLDSHVKIESLVDKQEGDVVQIPDAASPIRWKVIGDASAQSGTLTHAGYVAKKVALPEWTGTEENASIIAPAEVDGSVRLRLEKRV
jgi:Domain of unknown function (DUF2760).